MVKRGDVTPYRDPETVVQSRSNWSVEVGRHRLSVTRTRERRVIGGAGGAPARAARRSIWPVAAGVFTTVSAFGLVVVGAVATPRLAERARYAVSVPVPTTDRMTAASPAHLASGRTPSRLAALSRPAGDASSTRFEAGDEPHVAAAMASGEFQEWRDAAGQLRFLTAGTARTDAGRHCRDLALLTHLAGGGSHVVSERRCTSAELRDAPAATVDAATDVPDDQVPAPDRQP